ncbi:hypothetical protein [Streptomyces pacificus]|uniref:Helix-turn-helix domain-containing protein n=1 Tax=Streptomyces pacificus TaxID=2705029 RepID=A0A6A0AYA6_9ACTN|nr:hypothetical protein [Streptomyces pacificus]GFH36577.1 hypothetical protein SCWH03_28080 [Streptomyces pacificus]
MRRLDNGAPLRAAMKAAGLSVPRLAAKTKEADPERKGLSAAYVGFIVGQGETAREECSDRAAQLIAAALDRELAELFETVVFTLKESTSTSRSQTRNSSKPLPEQLKTQRQLARFLQKSMSWIDRQIQDDAEFPVHYAGRSRRFDPQEVLDYLRDRRKARIAC